MIRLVLHRLCFSIPTLLVCTALVFAMGALTGRSYYEKKKADPNVDLAQIRAEEKAEGLDQALWMQYLRWLGRLAFDVHWGRVELRVQDFEEPLWLSLGLAAGPGAQLAQTSSDAAAGRFSLTLRYRAEGRGSGEEIALRCDELAAFLRASWDGVDARSMRSSERFERDPASRDPLEVERYGVLRLSLRRGLLAPLAAESATLRLRGPADELRFERSVELDASGAWVDLDLPLELAAAARRLELTAAGELCLDALRVEERSRRFAWGAPNLGRSAKLDREVGEVLAPYVGNTLLLGALALIVTWAVALPLGVWCGVHRHGALDRVFSALAFLGLSLPSFFVALLALWLGGVVANDFAREWWGIHLFPTGGASSGVETSLLPSILDRLHHLVLPVAVVSVGSIASLQRITRGHLIEVLRANYIRTARAQGLPERRVIYRHALRNALNPLITLFGFQLSALLSGAALVEVIFSYPGLGKLVLEAIRDQDRNVVMAAILLSGVLLIVGNLVADLLLSWIDPRVRLGARDDV
ncbi:MAG: ABC transporter permease [Planctomycetes bacterium]|nr:ABC transporter permease [Planctomycetota bacterium]